MNNFTRFIHRSVIKSNLEEFFVTLRKRLNFIRQFIPPTIRHKVGSVGRFIPHPSSYPPEDDYLLTRGNTRFRINRSDYVQWRLFYGVRDNYLLEAMKAVTANSIVLDIGANFGAFSLRLASYVLKKKLSGVQIHSFEPNPAAVLGLRENLMLNTQLGNIVHIHAFGRGNEKTKLPFRLNSVNSGASRIISNEHGASIHIEIDRVDDVVKTINPDNISFIKMIVEGYEPQVFKGAINSIKRFRPPIFLK